MPNRKRLYGELAGTILVWIEEMPADPPFHWEARLIRRPGKIGGTTLEYRPDGFQDKSKESAIQNVELTIQQAPQFKDYGHRVNELRWMECDLSEEAWQQQVARFISEGKMEGQ